MIGNIKILSILITILLLGCKKQNETIDYKRELISQNINILIDSVESFDTSKMPVPPVSNKDFKNYKTVRLKQITIGLLDSIIVNENKLKINNGTNYLKFNLRKEDLINFKSKYKIKIVKVNNYDTNVLFVRFLNYNIQDDKSSIEVKKIIGISMLHHRYYFERENGVWVFKKKELLGMG